MLFRTDSDFPEAPPPGLLSTLWPDLGSPNLLPASPWQPGKSNFSSFLGINPTVPSWMWGRDACGIHANSPRPLEMFKRFLFYRSLRGCVWYQFSTVSPQHPLCRTSSSLGRRTLLSFPLTYSFHGARQRLGDIKLFSKWMQDAWPHGTTEE